MAISEGSGTQPSLFSQLADEVIAMFSPGCVPDPTL